MSCRAIGMRAILMAGIALCAAEGALAGDPGMEARIAALEAMVRELKSELADQKSQTDDQIERIQRAPASVAAPAARPASPGFAMGDVNVELGGFIDVDIHTTALSDGAIGAASIARDFYIPGATPIGGSSTHATDFTAEATRFFVKATKDVVGQKVTGYIEMDFLGSLQGDQRVSNSFSPRMRRAYVDFKGWRIGQEWTTFQNTSAIPESASFLVLSDGMVFIRQPQARFTSGNWQFAVENPNATITPVGGGRVEADSNTLPDLVARYDFKGDFGNVSLAALGRQLRYEAPGIDETTYGFGLSASGQVRIGARDDIRFNVLAGEGLGRYVGLNAANGASVNPTTGELEALPSYGGYLAYRHPFGETARLNIGYSGLFIENPSYAVASSTKSVQSAFFAVLWDPAPQLTLGVELMHGTRETEAGQSGDLTRATVSTKFAF
jgi:hypothetical protein